MSKRKFISFPVFLSAIALLCFGCDMSFLKKKKKETTPPPVADFTAIPTTGATPLTACFTNLSSGTITSWEWDFDGDGTTDSTEETPSSYTYENAGTYSVSLTTTGPGGSTTKTRAGYVVAGGDIAAPPNANFTAVATTGGIPFTVMRLLKKSCIDKKKKNRL
ncbi:MAG: PKD domain-containing protein [Planctomycetota bacterium]